MGYTIAAQKISVVSDWFIVSYDSGNQQEQYKEPSCKQVTSFQWKLTNVNKGCHSVA